MFFFFGGMRDIPPHIPPVLGPSPINIPHVFGPSPLAKPKSGYLGFHVAYTPKSGLAGRVHVAFTPKYGLAE